MPFNALQSIFPVLLFEFDPGETITGNSKVRDGHYLGTGFFVSDDPGAKQLLFAPARHVVDREVKTQQRIGIGHFIEGGWYWFQYFEFHSTADLAVTAVPRSSLPGSVRPLRCVKHDAVLALGQSVYTFGF